MKVVVYDGKGGLKFESARVPRLVSGGALLRLKACGISVSDLRAYRTRLVPKLFHKLAGEIVQISPDVSVLEEGARVYINSYYHCGQCSSCRRGFTNLCERRTYFYDGELALSEYVSLPPKFVENGGATAVGKNVSFEDATHVGPLSNCLNTLRAVEFTRGDSAVVMGAGPMGLLHVSLLRASGASKIVVLDVDEFRLEKSKEFGADYALNAHSTNAIDRVLELTDGGAEVVIVATGRPDAMRDSIKMARRRGRIDFFGGVALEPGDTSFNLDPNPVHYKELKIVGSYASLLDDYRAAADLITTGRVSPSRLDTHHFDLDHIQDALAAVDDSTTLRILIRL